MKTKTRMFLLVSIILLTVILLASISSNSFAVEKVEELTIEDIGNASQGFKTEPKISTFSMAKASTLWQYEVEENVATITGYTGTETNITIPSTIDGYMVKAIGRAAFYQNTNIKSVTIPNTVEDIEEGAFADCTNLSNITLGNAVQYIAPYAFQKTKITSINIPASVDNLNNLAFFHCENLTQITIAENNKEYKAINGVVFDKEVTQILIYPYAKKDTTYTIPSTVKRIREEAFMNNYLQKIVIPKSVDTIKTDLYCFTTPALTTIEVSSENPYFASVNGVLFSKDKKTIYAYPAGKTAESYTIPTGTQIIEQNAFFKAKYLKYVTIPQTVTTMEAVAFRYAEGLEEITIPSSVTEFGSGMFGDCPNLKKATINGNMEILSYLTFDECPMLEEVIVNGNIETIAKGAFYKCPKLTKVTLPDSLKTIINQAFFYCNSLKSITIPKNVEIIEAAAFYDYTRPPEYEADIQLDISKTQLKKQPDGSYIAGYSYSVKGTRDYEKAYQVLDIVNQYRQQNGLTPYVMDESLLETAMIRAAETVALFDHTRPNGMMYDTAITRNWSICGENIACYQRTAQDVMNSWMNSDGHRGNILRNYFDSIGIGCFLADDGNYYWTQVFIKGEGTPPTTKPANKSVVENILIRNSYLPFRDVSESEWYYQAIQYNVSHHYILGTNSSTFQPNTKISRAMMVTILWRMVGEPKVTNGKNFPAVKTTDYYYNAVKWASAKGIVNGYNSGKFAPNDDITREQLAVILQNYSKYMKRDVSKTTSLSKFKDGYKTTGYAQIAVKWAVATGVISGKDKGTRLDPQGTATRAEAAAMIYNYFTRMK